MLTFYDLSSRCWFLKPNGILGYVPDPELVWDASLDKFVVLHVDHIPGREFDQALRAKIGRLIPFRAR